MSASRAMKHYNKRIIILSLIYAVFLFGAVYLFTRHLIDGPLAYVAAILPAMPIIGIFAAIGRYFVEETDEYLRAQMVRQSLIATGFAMSVATAWGFLENFDLVPHVYAYYAAIVWFAGFGLGACVNKFSAPGVEA